MQKLDVLNSKVYALSMTITLLLLVQFLWLGFTLLGAIIFGYYPATIAAFQAMRHFKDGERPFKQLPHYFWQQYRAHFKVGNAIGVANVLLAYVLITNIRITTAISTNASFIAVVVLLTLTILFIIMQPYVLTVVTVSKDTFKKTIACAVLLALASPMSSVMFALISALYSLGFWYVPSIYMVLGITLPLFLLSIWAEPKITLLLDEKKELSTWTERTGM